MTTANLKATLSSIGSLLSLAADYDNAVALDPTENGAAAFIGAGNNSCTIYSADESTSYTITLALPENESTQTGNETGMTTWRGQLDSVIAAAKDIRDGQDTGTGVLGSGDGQYVLTVTIYQSAEAAAAAQ